MPSCSCVDIIISPSLQILSRQPWLPDSSLRSLLPLPPPLQQTFSSLPSTLTSKKKRPQVLVVGNSSTSPTHPLPSVQPPMKPVKPVMPGGTSLLNWTGRSINRMPSQQAMYLFRTVFPRILSLRLVPAQAAAAVMVRAVMSSTSSRQHPQHQVAANMAREWRQGRAC